jgi:two-component system nitrogen regulation sensor histidine kinase NtrY
MSEQLKNTKERGHFYHYRPVWITLLFLLGSVYLTTKYYKGIESSELFPSNILVVTLFNVNIILVILLILLLSRNLIKIYFERRLRLLGSGFRIKLIVAFVGLSLVPSLLLFGVASGLLTNSIDNWFSIQVDKSLESSLKIAQDAHQQAKESSLFFARELRKQIAEDPSRYGDLKAFLEGKLREFRVAGIEIYESPTQELIRVTTPEFKETPFLSPSPDLLKASLEGREVVEEVSVNHRGDHGKLMRGIVPLSVAHLTDPQAGKSEPLALPGRAPGVGASEEPPHRTGPHIIVVDLYLPQALLTQMDQITRSFEDYKQLKTFKNPIKGSYILSFLIITLLIIFSATWFGFYIAKGITVPIQKLAEATHALAQGNLDFRIDVKARDEIGVLVKSFNRMTEDLKGSKTKLEKSNAELDRRRAYIETILDNITAGVLSIDPEGHITTLNRAAERILNIKSDELRGKHYTEAFKDHKLEPLIDLLDHLNLQQRQLLEKELGLELKGKSLTLRVNLSRLQEDSGQPMGSVMVFDDLSELIKAQKVAAWQEVAKRIAHEIKNPLTPIQLSAQRLRKKYFEDSQDFHTIFDESTKIIISEVNSLKTLVDEFSNFARMPAPQPQPLDLHQVLQEVILLYEGAHKDIQILKDLDSRVPELMLDRDQIKRMFVNLFENAVEALNKRGRIWITSRFDDREQCVRLEVADEGVGIQPEDMDKLFVPYFSKKKTGTGLGLAIVNRIISDHNGSIRVVQNEPRGTRFVIELPI